jgi:predicted Zn finger-like uncharacterized protein
MLFTRCPDCDTTFRITDDTLKKANGQVRCGRCASVFNAYAELHDPAAKSFEAPAGATAPAAPPPPSAAALAPPASASAAPALPAASPALPASAPSTASAPSASTTVVNPADSEPAAADIEALSLAEVVAEVELAEAEDQNEPASAAPSAERDSISATEVDRVLTNATMAAPPKALAWPPLPSEPEASLQSRWWRAAAVAALLALGLQVMHHFRADIAGHPTFGPLIQTTYALFGAELVPHWDVHQYEILDWVASAEPSSRGLGSLKITARIQNRGPLRQPFPAVQLKLKDRWEESVGSRMFSPAEYLPSGAPGERLMSPGETARAEIEVVDPGPDAYGFELDVCIEVEASLVTCGSDEIFL